MKKDYQLDKDLDEHFKPSKLPQRGKAKYTTKEIEWFLDYLKRKRGERMNKYIVQFYSNNTYEVINEETKNSEYQGSLADCEAWIRLTEEGKL